MEFDRVSDLKLSAGEACESLPSGLRLRVHACTEIAYTTRRRPNVTEY